MSNWIKWSKGLAQKREVIVIASRFNRDTYEIAGRLMKLWEWCDENMDDTAFRREDAVMSLGKREDVVRFIDGITGLAGMTAALESPEVSWLAFENGEKVVFKKLKRHNGKSAKQRAQDQRKKEKQRKTKPKKRPVSIGTKTGPDERRREETRGDLLSSKGDRKTKGSSAPNGGSESILPKPPSSLSSPSPLNVSSEARQEEPFDLTSIDWGRVVDWAERVGSSIPPRSPEDRRMWLKFAVLADTFFTEDWLMDSVEAVIQAKETRSSRQAHLVGVLKSKAAEDHAIDEKNFAAMMGRIEIPKAVWKSNALEIQK